MGKNARNTAGKQNTRSGPPAQGGKGGSAGRSGQAGATGKRPTGREMRAEQAAAEQRTRTRNRILAWAGGLVALGLIAAIITVVVTSGGNGGSTPKSNASGALVTPAKATTEGAIPIGDEKAPVTVDLYVDFMCPSCGRFEKANNSEIDKMVQAGKAKFRVHPLSFLDRMSKGSRYSTRAANAYVTVADKAPDKLLAFNTALFANQPAENTPGLTDKKIAELATQAGVPQDVVDSFTKLTYEPWIAKSTDAAFKSGISGTPTVKINGKVFNGDVYSTGPLTDAVNAAAGKS